MKGRIKQNHPPEPNKPLSLPSDTEDTRFTVLLQSAVLSYLVFCSKQCLVFIASEEGRKTNRIHTAKYTLEE